jgi:hypothetical protein
MSGMCALANMNMYTASGWTRDETVGAPHLTTILSHGCGLCGCTCFLVFIVTWNTLQLNSESAVVVIKPRPNVIISSRMGKEAGLARTQCMFSALNLDSQCIHMHGCNLYHIKECTWWYWETSRVCTWLRNYSHAAEGTGSPPGETY